jgi:putative ABC transport system permease protein
MFRVNNNKVFRRLFVKDLFANKGRALLLFLSIVITQLVLLSVIVASSNYITALQRPKLSVDGMTYQAVLTSPTQQQLDKLSDNSAVKYSGQQIACGTILTVSDKTTVKIVMKWKDTTNWQHQTIPALTDVKGRYPEKENEIMLSQASLKDAQLSKYRIGMPITLNYLDKNGQHAKTFRLSGYFSDNTELNGSSSLSALVSKSFLETTGYDNSETESSKVYLSFRSPFLTQKKMKHLKNKLKLTQHQVFLYDNELTTSMLTILLGGGALAILILVASYLVIFNIVYLSLIKDVKTFGLYNAIGMTDSQIKKIFYYQIMLFAIVGISLGTLLSLLLCNEWLPTSICVCRKTIL